MRFALILLLFSACSACGAWNPPSGLTPSQQHNAMVQIRTTCLEGQKFGSGVLVDDRYVLTATHVIGCDIIPGLPLYKDANKVEVYVTGSLFEEADVEVNLIGWDVSRLKLKSDKLAEYVTPVRVGAKPKFGERVCEISAVPRPTYRCGEVQESPAGRIVLGFSVESGNSGSGIFNSKGELVGIVTNLIYCQGMVTCSGYGTALIGWSWLVPTE